MDVTLTTAQPLHGEVTVPGDKSISHRSVMIGGIARGTTRIKGFLQAADPLSTLSCFRSMGVSAEFRQGDLLINGTGLRGLQPPGEMLDAGNSGTTIRLLSGILCGQKFPSVIGGDQYLRQRPMKRIIDPLRLMGADIAATGSSTAPLTITPVPSLHAIQYTLPVASAQVKSAVLLAGLYADGTTTVYETTASRDHTERMLGLPVSVQNGVRSVSITGGMEVPAGEFFVPGDPSSAAFFIVAGLIVKGSDILLKNVGLNPTRTGYLDVLRRFGGRIEILDRTERGGEPIGDIHVRSSDLRTNIVLDGDIIPNIIDEIPVLAVAAAFGEGSFAVRNARELRAKESDRIAAICRNLQRMGIETEEYEDGFAFERKMFLLPHEFDSGDDHRIAMAFAVAALAVNGPTIVTQSDCVTISYPEFWNTLTELQQ